MASAPVNANQEILLPPSAPVLLESMRAIGYSFESALADIIDNSISAGARNISVQFSPYCEPYLAVVDDGCGMDPDRLTDAMRLGSSDPRTARLPSDLGRFGLGLKTASLSQCRRLTVISKTASSISGKRWDLDTIERRADWILLGLSQTAIHDTPHADELAASPSGTIVVWQLFDRLAAGESSVESALGQQVDRAREHLALVFHRFLNPGKPKAPIRITINGNPVAALDPFLSSHRATQALPEERIDVGGAIVEVAPFILPHITKLSEADRATAGGELGLRRNQGFYVYRNRRLITWGSWFRLIRQEEITKLARVRVDIPNSLDHLWTIDVRKSAAYPPQVVRERLKGIVPKIADGSRRVYTYRGRQANDGLVHVWERTESRGGVEYCINRDHPMIEAIEAATDDGSQPLIQRLLQTIETTFPFDAAYADMASDRRPASAGRDSRKFEELFALAISILDALGREGPAARQLIDSLNLIEPFCRHPDEAAQIQRNLRHAE